MPRNWQHAAGIIWPKLCAAARQGRTLAYRDLAPLIATNPLSVGRALGPIQSHCLENRLPPLTALVVNAGTGLPGNGFIAWDADDFSTALKLVFAFSWDAVPNPYAGFGPNDTTRTLARRLVLAPDEAGDVYAQVRVRGVAQNIFRAALLQAYDGRCAFCGMSFAQAQDAAHIKSWRQCVGHERLDPANGLLLCATHHRLFDAGLMTLDTDLCVVCADLEMEGTPGTENGGDSDADRTLTRALHGRRAYLPRKKALRPSRDFLRAHYLEKNWEGME
jgi:putative restriction endonuclease